MSGGTNELYALAESSMGWDAIHVQQLKGAKPKSYQDGLRQSKFRALEQRLDAGVEGDLPA
jgi:hypothetical protein